MSHPPHVIKAIETLTLFAAQRCQSEAVADCPNCNARVVLARLHYIESLITPVQDADPTPPATVPRDAEIAEFREQIQVMKSYRDDWMVAAKYMKAERDQLQEQLRATVPREELEECLAELKSARTHLAITKGFQERYGRALAEIINRFSELNGRECSEGCGKCIKCIAEQAMLVDADDSHCQAGTPDALLTKHGGAHG